MNITVFGASGKVGRLVVASALQRGYHVTAFVHRSNSFSPHPDLRIVQGDIHDSRSVVQALDGADAVIGALGSWGTKRKDVLSQGMRSIIPAMESASVQRIVSLTGNEAHHSSDNPTLFVRLTHALLLILAPKILKDAEDHLRQLAVSGLNWTVIRSPVMTGSRSRRYSLTSIRPAPWRTIPRAAVAEALLDAATDVARDKAWSCQAPFIRSD